MGGLGPVPKESRQRDRDTPVREMVIADGKIGGFDLPDDVLPVITNENSPRFGEREEWNPQTVRWWTNWRMSPQATRMLTGPDWDYMLDTALMHHQMWESGGKNSERAAEIRLRVAAFGATPADRLRLKLEIDVPAEFDAGANAGGDAVITSLQDRRKRLTGG